MDSTSVLSDTSTNWHRRIAIATVAVSGVVVIYTYVYQWLVFSTTGAEISFVQALQVVIEALTTAGFGGDTDAWRESDALAGLVILMNLSGVFLVFLAIPLFAVPLFRRAFETQPPTSSSLTDHVIICGHNPQDETLREELDTVGVPYLYVLPDREAVKALTENGLPAILGDPEQTDTLRAANAADARALVADIDDETNPTVILSAEQIDPDLRTISIVRSAEAESYHRYAGADEVVLARQLLGKSLGLRAAGSYAEKLRKTIAVESDLQVTELLVNAESDLVGKTFREATVFDREGITVIGAWIGGKFIVSPNPDTRIERHTILLVAGAHETYGDLKARPIPTHENDGRRVIVGGYGTVGRSITDAVRDEAIETTVIDVEAKDGVDIVGDLTDRETFDRTPIDDARAVVLSLDEDTPTIYATLIVNQLAPDVEVIARADDDETVQKLYNAGADFVIPLETVTGKIVASLLIDAKEIVTPDVEFEFVRTEAPPFVGRTLGELDVRDETGCTVVAVERDGDLLTDIGAAFVVEPDDILIVAGGATSRKRFHRLLETNATSTDVSS
ncbi:TrkA family potassium uptake protein [Natronorubrum sp. JWXQ-INN-674]|uniref:TrkA family potassium uptake protein n=1 Tax=Natronorubrum halalkaliphilum TaxID=2691917 RepID=A0A6B0VKZ2_9EURY|nr:NAD-binding protein [Natronorubrum halalkaliphilum]MXV62234.1 TrkA family potassium uptake protein [Natronorubrum halalkaliphilum]